MVGYVVFQGDVFDSATYDRYKPLAAESVAQYGGKYLIRGGNFISLAGELPPSRNVVIEFPSVAAAQEWYESVEYAEARPLRNAASSGRLFIIEG